MSERLAAERSECVNFGAEEKQEDPVRDAERFKTPMGKKIS